MIVVLILGIFSIKLFSEKLNKAKRAECWPGDVDHFVCTHLHFILYCTCYLYRSINHFIWAELEVMGKWKVVTDIHKF